MGLAVKYLRTVAQIEFSITRILKRFDPPFLLKLPGAGPINVLKVVGGG